MEEKRATPEQYLKSIKEENKRTSRGHLHIFFGYAAGVGKTYAMLKAAHKTMKNGFDIMVGYLEPHMRPATSMLVEGLKVVPTKAIVHGNITLQEFDLDRALELHPQFIVVDELAHTNAVGCRHEKRYQDVEELLCAGINVYTTINVQHLESLNDIVASITGVIVRERVPDKMFDEAYQVRLVDIEPQELIERLNEGKIYNTTQAKKAIANFFTIENLTALREIALRRCADRVNILSEASRVKSGNEYYTDEHILVCLSSSPTNQKIIRNAARMAKAFHGGFTALFVETPAFLYMKDDDKKRLRENIHLAQQLGATIETTYGDDVALQISEFAGLSGVSKIVVGRSSVNKKPLFGRQTLTEKLISYAPNLDVYVIPDHTTAKYQEEGTRKEKEKLLPSDIFKSVGILALATAIGYVFKLLGFSEANIITVYILGVLITAVVTTMRMYSLISSVLSVLIFNFFFTVPEFTLNVYDSGYPATFLIMFLSAFITSTLGVKIKQHARQSAATAHRTKILLDTSQMLSLSKDTPQIINTIVQQLKKLLHRDIVYYIYDNYELCSPITATYQEGEIDPDCISDNERAVAAWVVKNNKHAGATTATLSNAKCRYLAVRTSSRVYGVVGIVMGENQLDSFENNILLSILGEGALALEKEFIAMEKEQAAVLAKNEQLRANLLRSISHDLRTPLTCISGNAGLLMESSQAMSQDKKHQLYSNIYDDSLWLINLVQNLLAVTKIEDGSMQIKMKSELLDEIIDEALRHVSREGKEENIIVNHSQDFLLVKIDAQLIMQLVINLVDNAIKYTPKGSIIKINSFKNGKNAVVSVSDNGTGIDDESKLHIFDMFYTAEKVVDSRRSLGLGLALCKSIVTAHGGSISVTDNRPSGSVFTFTLPMEEVKLHE